MNERPFWGCCSWTALDRRASASWSSGFIPRRKRGKTGGTGRACPASPRRSWAVHWLSRKRTSIGSGLGWRSSTPGSSSTLIQTIHQDYIICPIHQRRCSCADVYRQTCRQLLPSSGRGALLATDSQPRKHLARDLAAVGLVVVSGLARGIDGAAHTGALEAGGQTIAVLGCGLDIAYPPEHGQLMEQIALDGGIVTEYPLGTAPRKPHFPLRNRIIAGMCQGVIVPECGRRKRRAAYGQRRTRSWARSHGRTWRRLSLAK